MLKITYICIERSHGPNETPPSSALISLAIIRSWLMFLQRIFESAIYMPLSPAKNLLRRCFKERQRKMIRLVFDAEVSKQQLER